MALVERSPAKVEIPLETFRELERRIGQVRSSVLAQYKEVLAASHGRGTSTRSTLNEALKRVAEEGTIRPDQPSIPPSEVNIPVDERLAIEARLDVLRTWVIQMAAHQVTERDPSICLTKDSIARGWQIVWSNPALRQASLLGSTIFAPAPLHS